MKVPAASVIVPAGNSRYVGITRGNNTSDICFPGGRGEVDDGHPAVTAARELYEETGLVVAPESLELLVVRPDGWHYTYLATFIEVAPPVLQSDPFEGWVGIFPEEAFYAQTCTYANPSWNAFTLLNGKVYVQPPKAAQVAARKGLEARARAPKSKRGGLTTREAGRQGVGSGVARARDIVAGKRVDAKQVKAFFDRHEHNYKKAMKRGLKPEESRAIQAWLLWGGDPMRKAAQKALRGKVGA